MSSNTPRFGFLVLDSDRETVAKNNYQFGTRDRQTIDATLAYVLEHHLHDGRTVPVATRPSLPLLELQTAGGHIPAGAKVSYRYAFVDERGQEFAASDLASAVVPFQIGPPSRLTVSAQPGVGTVPAGTYAYTISAYVTTSTNETATSPALTTMLSAAGRVTIGGPPVVESNETGYNVYRRGPGDADYLFLDSFAVGDTLIDNGSITPDANHRRPTGNTTHSTNQILVTPTAVRPAGHTWKLYRTYDETRWDATLLYWGTAASFLDQGAQTRSGTPTDLNTAGGSPPKVDLTDAAQVTGTLPPGLNVFYTQQLFRFTPPSF